jgi:hypothetical protein
MSEVLQRGLRFDSRKPKGGAMNAIAEKKNPAEILEEFRTKSFDYREGFIAGMLYAQGVFNETLKVSDHAD